MHVSTHVEDLLYEAAYDLRPVTTLLLEVQIMRLPRTEEGIRNLL